MFCLFVVKVSMPMLRMVHAKLLIKKHMYTMERQWHVFNTEAAWPQPERCDRYRTAV